jgi:hypothetical protein
LSVSVYARPSVNGAPGDSKRQPHIKPEVILVAPMAAMLPIAVSIAV